MSGVEAESKLRYFGLFLQISGLLTASYGLFDKLKRFRRGSKKKVTFSAEAGRFILKPGSALIRLNDQTLEERVTMLEEQVLKTQKKVKDVESIIRKHNAKLERIGSNLQSLQKSINNKFQALLEKSQMKYFSLELFGLALIIIGIIVKTLSLEFACWHF